MSTIAAAHLCTIKYQHHASSHNETQQLQHVPVRTLGQAQAAFAISETANKTMSRVDIMTRYGMHLLESILLCLGLSERRTITQPHSTACLCPHNTAACYAFTAQHSTAQSLSACLTGIETNWQHAIKTGLDKLKPVSRARKEEGGRIPVPLICYAHTHHTAACYISFLWYLYWHRTAIHSVIHTFISLLLLVKYHLLYVALTYL